ncbi:MAG: hypothetical protein V4580_14255 [Bacteroidota bacterium]
MIFGRDDLCATLSIIDIQSGDLLYFSKERVSTGKTFDDELIGKLLKDLEEKK